MTDWQPIETAPKDGSKIDLWVVWNDTKEGERLTNCFWGESWICGNDLTDVTGWVSPTEGYDGSHGILDPEDRTPTHWMPIPPASAPDWAKNAGTGVRRLASRRMAKE